MKKFVKGVAALLVFGALSFGTVEAAEIPDALENPVERQELKAKPWREPPPPPPRHRRYEPPPPPMHRHEPPHFHRRPNDFEPPPRYLPPPPPPRRW